MQTTRSFLYTSAAVLSLVTAGSAFAAPEDGVVARGSATITQSGKKTDIRQTSNKVILDWRSFDIGADEHTEFHQPSKNAIALNRINDTKASRIDGKLSANGNIMLINPNGVVFGAGAQVDVGSLTATTADIDNDDFMAGKMDFKNAGNTAGAIINNGSISVKDAGLVNFVAPKVENNGVIVAKLGKVQLAAADTFTLDMAGDGVLQVAVSEEDSQKIARNSGSITAEGGYVAVTAAKARGLVDSLVDNTGVIEASSMSAKGGKIILSADGGTTSTSGMVKANGQTGGDILIGGDYQGKGATKNSKTTNIASGAVVEASATAAGDGGTVIVWSDEKTDVAGSITAKGGAISGKGGFVETSSKKLLTVDAATSIAVGGKSGAGEWLVDPEDIVISDAGNDGNPATSDIATATINGTLNGGGNVTITTSGVPAGNGDITVTNAAINKSTANNDATLTLQAHRNIVVSNSTINSTSGDALNVVLNADRDANQVGSIGISASTINTNGGNLIAGGGDGAVGGINGILGDGDGTGADDVAATTNSSGSGITIANSNITTSGGTAIFNGRATGAGTSHGVQIDISNISTGTGDIRMTGHSTGNTSNPKGITFSGNGSGVSILTTDGDIDLIATSTVSQAFYVWEDVIVSTTNGDINISAYNGNGVSDIAAGGVTPTNTISSTNGDVTITAHDANITDFQTISAGGTLSIIPYNATTTIGLGGGAGDLNFTDVELSRLSGSGKLVIGNSAGGGGNVIIQSWDLSSKLFDTEIYGNNITIGGLTMGQDFMAYAMAGVNFGDMNISANITRAVNGDATLDLRADRNIVNSNNSDIVASDANSDGDANAATSADRLNVILNSDRNANGSGAVALTNATVTTLGGDFIVGGGLDPLANATQASNREIGIELNNTQVSTAAGNISMIGRGENSGNDNYGISLGSNSSLLSTDGNITVVGYGGNGNNSNLGLYLSGSSIINSANGDIQLTGTGGSGYEYNYGIGIAGGSTVTSAYGTISIDATSGSNGLAGSQFNDGLVVEGSSTISSTGTGAGAATISIDSTATAGTGNGSGVYLNSGRILTNDGDIDITGHTLYYAGIALGYNALVEADGSADITLTGTESVGFGAGALQSANGSNRIGGANTTGTITLIGDTINYSDISIETSGITHVKGYTPSTSIGLGGGAGTLNLSDAELGYFNGTGTLVIGDSALGTGDMDVDSWDISADSYDVELYGNDIDVGGLTMGSGNFMAHAMDNGVDYGDVNISANITRAVNGEAMLDLRADRSITNSNGADIVASDANSDADGNAATDADSLNIIFNADRDGDQDGFVNITDATIITLGGDFVAGGGGGAVGGVNGILGDGDGTGADDVMAWGNASIGRGVTLTTSTVTTGDGMIVMNGRGYDNALTTSHHGINLLTSGLYTTSGRVLARAEGGDSSTNAYGFHSNGSTISTVSGDIDITGVGGGSATNDAAMVFFNSSVVESTDSGSIYLAGTGSVNNGNFSIGAGGANRIGHSNMTGNIEITVDTLNISDTDNTILTQGDIIVAPTLASTSIGLGGGSGTLNLTDAEIATFNGTGRLIIGDAAGGTGDIDLDSVDLSAKSFDVELYGNGIDIGGLTMGSGNFMAYAKDNGVDYGDLNISANITRARNGNATLDLRADRNITNSNNSDIIASDANSDADGNPLTSPDLLTVILNADRDGDLDGAINLSGATITTMGGDFIAGGGSGTIGGINGILGDGDGTGADDTAAWGNSVSVEGISLDSTTISTGAGSIHLTGHGLNTTTDGNHGVFLQGSSLGTVDGSIYVSGTAGIGGGNNRGVYFLTSNVNAAGTGDIIIEGRGNDSTNVNTGTYNIGYSHEGGTVSAHGGLLDIRGYGGTSNNWFSNYGFEMAGGANITNSNAGDIYIYGQSGGTSANSNAIRVWSDNNSITTSGSGDITLEGTTTSPGAAINLTSANSVRTTGTGDIFLVTDSLGLTIDAAVNAANDVYLGPRTAGASMTLGNTAGSTVNFDDTVFSRIVADRLIVGHDTGGNGDIVIDSLDLSTRAYDLEIYGNDINIAGLTMGAGDFIAYAQDNGVDHGDLVVSAAITRGVAAVSALNLNADRNITFNSGAAITSTTGEIDLDVDADHDSAGGGSIVYNAASIDTNGGDITFADAVAVGADADWNARGGTFTSGGAITLGAYDLDITADSVALGGNITGNASSILTLKPYDNSRSIGLGGGAGGFNLSDAELTGLNVGHLVIGDSASGAGDIAIQSWSLSGKSYDIELYGRDIDINGMTMGGGAITMIAGNDVTTSGAVGNSGAGGDLYIDVGNDFTNTAGAAAIIMGAGGRYLIYIDTLSNITRGGMTTGNLFGRDYTNDDPSTINTAFGNRFVFDETPTITVQAGDVTLGAYDGAYNSFTYAVSGLATGDTAGSALSGTPAYAKTQLTPTTYSVTPSTGSLVSTLGYLVSFQSGTLTMPVSSGGGTPPTNSPSSPVYNIPASVEQQIQLPDLVIEQGYELMTQASPYVKSFTGSSSNIENRIINRKSKNFRVTTDEADSFTRMIEGGYLQLDQPTADYYGLLFYNAAYSEAP